MSADPAAFAFFTEVAIIEHLSRTAAERVMPEGLSMAGFSVLNHMIRLGHENEAPARLASALQVTKGAMTGTLKRLEAAGLVQVDPDPDDGRGKQVRVTEAGRKARSAAIAALGPLFDQMLEGVDEAELEAALPLLRKVRQMLDAARD
jgi:DNA-binding MarR family transcriptional regulator